MKFRFNCPYCGHSLYCVSARVGAAIKCPVCGREFKAPRGSTPGSKPPAKSLIPRSKESRRATVPYLWALFVPALMSLFAAASDSGVGFAAACLLAIPCGLYCGFAEAARHFRRRTALHIVVGILFGALFSFLTIFAVVFVGCVLGVG